MFAEIKITSGMESVVLDPQRFETWRDQVFALFAQNPLVGCLLVLMFIDVLTGYLAAFAGGELASAASFKGLCRKGIVILIIGAAKVMEVVIPGAPLANMGAFGFCGFELFSIVENAGRAGVPLPASLKNAFERLREKKLREDSKVPIVEVNVDNQAPQANKRPSDVVINVRDSGEMDVVDNNMKSRVIVPKAQKGDTGQQGEQGEQGETGAKGDKGDRGDSYPPGK